MSRSWGASGGRVELMKLRITLANRETEIDIRREGSRAVAQIDNRRYEVDVHERGIGGWVLTWDGRVFDSRIEGRPASGRPTDVIVGTERYSITITDPKRLRGALSASAHGDGLMQIVAAMPGKVVRLLVEVGEKVQAEQGIVTVEAMKMQNEMKSPKAGMVVAVNVQAGVTVNAGDVLAVIE